VDSTIVADAYAEHREALYGYLLALTRDQDAAEDAVQEAFARLTREVNAGRLPDNLRAWLFRVGRNLVTSAGRRQQVAQRYQPRLATHDVVNSAEDQYLAREEQSWAQAILAGLPELDRRSLTMAALGYSGREIGRAVGCRENAVRTRLCRLRARIRAYAEQEAAGA
jgi:RNA polymerase sigma factor (sigma-70 family)